jgi:hypothetical protein
MSNLDQAEKGSRDPHFPAAKVPFSIRQYINALGGDNNLCVP